MFLDQLMAMLISLEELLAELPVIFHNPLFFTHASPSSVAYLL